MEWFLYRRRGQESSERGSTQASVSMPPLQLLAVLAIVVSLLCFSHYTGYRAKLEQTATALQLFLFLFPILLIFFISYFGIHRASDWLGRRAGHDSVCHVQRSEHGRAGHDSVRRMQQSENDTVRGAGGSPWAVAVLVVVLLVLVSYQSSFSF